MNSPSPRPIRARAELALFVFSCLIIATVKSASAQDATPVATPAASSTTATSPSTNGTRSVEEELVFKYSPIVYMIETGDPCDKSHEAYYPVPVETVLGNGRIALFHDDEGEKTKLVDGPTASDIFRQDDTEYLKYPGNPRAPGCTYARDFKELLPLPAVTYAHVATEEGEDGFAIQYWFFYYFNDADNTHEGDWEMIQLSWFESTPEEAWTQGIDPDEAAYAQHNGGETSDWDDPKLSKEDGHPGVYPAKGSHPSHYGDDIYLGYGEDGAGLGCDESAGPHTRFPVTPILVPTDVTDQDSPLAWLTYEGLWGQKESAMWSGPTGPNAKPRWTEPFTWQDGLRGSSISVGEENPGGLSPVNVFCKVVAFGGNAVNLDATNPTLFFTLVGIALVVIAVMFWFTRRTLLRAVWLYIRHARTWVLLGLAFIPVTLLIGILQALLSLLPPVRWVLRFTDQDPSTWFLYSLGSGSLLQLPVLILLGPTVAKLVADFHADRPTGIIHAFRESLKRWKVTAGAVFPAWLKIVLLSISVVGLPWAIIRVVRWAFIPAAVILDEADTSKEATRLSANASRGHWWRAALTIAVMVLIGVIAGPVLGALIMVGLHWKLGIVSAVSSLIGAASTPFALIGITILYHEFRSREQEPTSSDVEPAL